MNHFLVSRVHRMPLLQAGMQRCDDDDAAGTRLRSIRACVSLETALILIWMQQLEKRLHRGISSLKMALARAIRLLVLNGRPHS